MRTFLRVVFAIATLSALACSSDPSRTVFVVADSGRDRGDPADAAADTARPSPDVAADDATDDAVADAQPTDTARDIGAETSADTASVDGGPDACVGTTVPILLKPTSEGIPNVILVVDRSYSMIQNPSRWTGVTAAVRAVTAGLDDVIRFGMVLFPAPGDVDECAPGALTVDPELRSAGDVDASLARYEPLGGTPTAPSLLAAGEILSTRFPGGNNHVLLATDGGPGCNPAFAGSGCECIPGAFCGDDFWANCLDDDRTLAAVENLSDLGISTFVFGVPGSEVVSALLDRMAIVGGTAVDGAHFAVEDGDALLEALRGAAGSLAPCEYSVLDGPDGGVVTEVRVDGTLVPNDASNGWVAEGDGDLVFTGAACETLRDGSEHRIEALFDC